MNPKTYTVKRGEKFTTINTCGGAVGAACGLYPDLRPPSWTVVEDCSPWASHTIVNGEVDVFEHRL